MKVGSYFNESVSIVSGIPQFETNINNGNSKQLVFKFKLKFNSKKQYQM